MLLEQAKVAARIEQFCTESDSLLTFAVCCDEDSRSLTVALELKKMIGTRKATILARMSSRGGLATLLCGDDPKSSLASRVSALSCVEGIYAFGMIETLAMPGEGK